MSLKSPWSAKLLWTFCARKVAHPDRKSAEEAIAQVKGEVLHAYHCPACKKWHVGHHLRGWVEAEKIYGVATPTTKKAKKRHEQAIKNAISNEQKKREQKADRPRRMAEQQAEAKKRKEEKAERHRLLVEEQKIRRSEWLRWEGEGGLLSFYDDERHGFRA